MKRIVMIIICTLLLLGVQYAYAGNGTFSPVRSEGGVNVFEVIPTGGSNLDSFLFTRVGGTEYQIGRQIGVALAPEIANILGERYSCATESWLRWMEDEYYPRQPQDDKDQVRGLYDGLKEKGRNFRFGVVVAHALQPMGGVYGFQFFMCPWRAPTGAALNYRETEGGSYSLSVTKTKKVDEAAVHILSPDWGKVPPSITRRVLLVVEPEHGYRYATFTVPGVLSMTGFNETGLVAAGTSGQASKTLVTPMPENGIPVYEGYRSLFSFGREMMRTLSGKNPADAQRVTEAIRANPIDAFILHIGGSAWSRIFEPGCTSALTWPECGMRLPNEYQGGFTPVDFTGDLLLTQGGVFCLSCVNGGGAVTITHFDGAGVPYAGTVLIEGKEEPWQHRSLGRLTIRPHDPDILDKHESWAAAFGTAQPRKYPVLIADDMGTSSLDGIAVVSKDGTHGYFASGTIWGRWEKDSTNTFHAETHDGQEVCRGNLYPVGQKGVLGFCTLADGRDVQFVAWRYDYTTGCSAGMSYGDGMNLSVVPSAKPYAQTSGAWRGNHPLPFTDHNRTHVVRGLVAESCAPLTVGGMLRDHQSAYYAVNGQDAPFQLLGVDLNGGSVVIAPSGYDETGTFVGGSSARRIWTELSWNEIFRPK